MDMQLSKEPNYQPACESPQQIISYTLYDILLLHYVPHFL